MKTSVVLVFTILFSYGMGLHLPSDWEICKRSQNDFDECIRRSMQHVLPQLEEGLPEFKFPSIQPLRIPSLTVGEGIGAVHIVQKYKNVEIYNVPKAKFTKTKLTIDEKSFKLLGEAHFDELRLEADYDFNGQFLVLPVIGNGKCIVTLTDVTATIDLTGEVIKKKNIEYVDLTDFVLKFTPKHGHYNFTNLFSGDENLTTETVKVLNENWKDVFDDIKPGYEEALGAILRKIANLVLKKIPVKEAFPE